MELAFTNLGLALLFGHEDDLKYISILTRQFPVHTSCSFHPDNVSRDPSPCAYFKGFTKSPNIIRLTHLVPTPPDAVPTPTEAVPPAEDEGPVDVATLQLPGNTFPWSLAWHTCDGP